MRTLLGAIALIGSVVVGFGSSASAANVTVDFDEFTSPPVTCCYGGPIVGPLVYPTVTVSAGDGGTVMNGSGWQNEQTSGDNLFGTLSGSIELSFTNPVSNLALDVLNGMGAATFTVDLYDANGNLFSSISNDLPNWPSAWHYAYAGGGISEALILGNGDFAIDTVTFSTGAVPEVSTWGMMCLGFAGLGFAGFRSSRKARAAFAA